MTTQIQLQNGARIITLKEETRFVSDYAGRGIRQEGITLPAGTQVNYSVSGNKYETWHTAFFRKDGTRYTAHKTTETPFVK